MSAILVPYPSIVFLIGIAGAGKSTFARQYFRRTEIISSDFCRALVSDDDKNQAVSSQAFELVHHILRLRLLNGKLAVIDATNLHSFARESLFQIADAFPSIPRIGIVFNLPIDICIQRDQNRRRNVGVEVMREQYDLFLQTLPLISQEPFSKVYQLDSETAINSIELIRIFSEDIE